MEKRILGLWAVAAGLCSGAITGVRVQGTTATQAVISYTAPDSSACTLEVSESSSLTPLVHDVNPALFPGSNTDGRSGNVTSGRSRTFVVGKRAAETAAGGKRYSRALQADTVHHYRITCGSDTASGTFRTANIPLGNTRTDALPADPGRPGDYAWPSLDWTARAQLPGYVSSETIVDPQTGILLRRATAPRDRYYDDTTLLFSSAIDPAAAWDTEAAALSDSDGGAGASYSGTASPQAWLYLRPAGIANNYEAQYQYNRLTLDYYILTLKAACTDSGCATASEEDRKLEVCLTVDGVACKGRVNEVILAADGVERSYVIGDGTPLMAAWTLPGQNPVNYPEFGTRTGSVSVSGTAVSVTSGAYFSGAWGNGSKIVFDGATECTIQKVDNGVKLTLAPGCAITSGTHSYAAPNFGVLARKKSSSSHRVKIQYASAVFGQSWANFEWTAGGDTPLCSPTTVNDAGGNPGYHCLFSGEMYWISRETGETRLVSRGYIPGGSGGGASWGAQWCNLFNPVFDPSDANVFYCVGSSTSGAQLVLKARYTGDNTALPGYNANTAPGNLTVTNLTAGTDLEALIQAFDPSYDASKFSCTQGGIQPGKLIVTCMKSTQDSLAWTVVYDLAANQVVAASNTWSQAPQRWCVSHGAGAFGNSDWAQVGTNSSLWANSAPGTGPYRATITSGAVPASGSACPARPTGSPIPPAEWPVGNECLQVTVDGEPCDAVPGTGEPTGHPSCGNPAAYYLQDAMAGDYFLLDYEHVRLLIKEGAGGRTWWLHRGIGSDPFSPHTANSTLNAVCGGWTPAYDFDHGNVFWNYTLDARAINIGGGTVVTDPYFQTAHWAYHNDTFFEAGNYSLCGGVPGGHCYQARRGAGSAWINAVPTIISMSPPFAGVSGLGNSSMVQTHSGILQTAASENEKQWALDARPYLYSPVDASLAAGMTQVYKVTGLTLNRKKLDTAAACGKNALIDASGPNSAANFGDGPAYAYKFCVAGAAGECVPGSAAGDMYVNCPRVTYTGSGVCYSRTAVPTYETEDLCVADQGTPTQAMIQLGFGATDYAGKLSRVLSRGLSRYKLTSEFWSLKSLPDASWAIVRAEWLDKARTDIFVAKLPPYPAKDSVNRGQFVPIPVQLKPPAGLGVNNAVVEFGYAENGDPDQYYCTSRQESCVKGSQSGVDYSFAGESYSGAACASGCTVEIPAIPQRVLYYRVVYRDAQNTPVATGKRQVAIAP